MNAIINRARPVHRLLSTLGKRGPTTLVSSQETKPSSIIERFFSTEREEETPSSLEHSPRENILGMKASSRRTFSPNSNAQAMLLSGGMELAKDASFDPIYSRAQKYIRNHAVGPAVLSPILIQGLVGTLIESSLPQSFFVENRLKQLRPLIVGVEVEAQFEVISSVPSATDMKGNMDGFNNITRSSGKELVLGTSVRRVSDGALIAEGEQVVWLPDYVTDI